MSVTAKALRFSTALGRVNERFVEEAACFSAKKRKRVWRRAVPVAACLVLAVLGGVLLKKSLTADAPGRQIESYFIITAHAGNGDVAELLPGEGFFNSATAQDTIFGAGQPLFSFTVQPSAPEGNRALYSAFDISVSYNGVPVGGKDEHMMVGYSIPVGSDGPWSYWISGWCAGAADVTVTVTEKETGESVEHFVVHVAYCADRQEYELEITERETVYPERPVGE